MRAIVLCTTCRYSADAPLGPDGRTGGETLIAHMREAIAGAGVIMMLRVQLERQHESAFPASEYFGHYGLRLDHLQLASPDVIVMHPGPMNREVEIASDVADGPQAVILKQVTFGIAVRMAIMSIVTGN